MIKKNNKGKQIVYKEFNMSSYLMPNDVLTHDEKKRIFQLRSESFIFAKNFNKDETNCICNNKLNLQHIYECKMLNNKDMEENYDAIYNNDI